MLELKNSKTTPLGGKRFALDAFIGAVQMREPDGEWQDIKPHLVRDNDGWHIEGAPYYAEVKDDGTRLFCPDRNEKSKFIRLTTPLVSGLQKHIMATPTKLDRQLLANKILMPTPWGEIYFIFTNTGLRFEVLLNKAPSFHLLPWTKKESFIFDVESSGLDISKLLTEEQGLGIPKPRLIEADKTLLEPKEKMLGWSFKDGQLELGFDLAGLKFPVILKNTTIDKQVDASTDDCAAWGVSSFSTADTSMWLAYPDAYHLGGMRWTGVNITQGATINVAYVTYRARATHSGATTCRFWAEDNVSEPLTFSDRDDFDARVKTTAYADWDIPDWTNGSYYDSSSMVEPIQEAVNAVAVTHLVLLFDDLTHTQTRRAYSYDGLAASAPQLHIEYEEAAAGAKRGWWSK